MPSRRPVVLAVVAALLVSGCGGGDDDASPDAFTPAADGGGGDAGPQPGCDHVEQADGDNDGAGEPSGLSVGPGRVTICGSIRAGEPGGDFVDVDRYQIAIEDDRGVAVRLVSAGGGALGLLGVELQLGDGETSAGRGLFVGDHLVFTARVAPGTYELVVFAAGNDALPLDVGYRLELVGDDLDARCVRLTGAAAYTEQLDGPEHTGNDVVEVRWGDAPTLTDALDDAPEPTAIVLSAAMDYRLSGALGASDIGDDYGDRDTYLVLTGNQTNQLDVRVTWQGEAADLDVIVFATADPEAPLDLAAGATAAKGGDELMTTAVLPSTAYWVWVGAYDGSTGQPIAYDATLCARRHAP